LDDSVCAPLEEARVTDTSIASWIQTF
jgi:hypothetical protein